MSIAVVGINHRTVALEDLEPLLVAPDALDKALADLLARPHLDEVVVLSTCVRTEVYAVVNRFHGAMADIREFLATWSGKAPDDFSSNLYSYFDEAAVKHLFRVASGLDSASLGEPEVLGQVRQAWEVAEREGSARAVLSGAFRHAVQVGKRARTETAISRGTTSLSHAAVALAKQALGGLAGKRALVIGLGEVGEAAARALAGEPGALPPLLANRTRTRAEKLAGALGAQAVPWESLSDGLAAADVVFCCAGNKGPSISAESLVAARAQARQGCDCGSAKKAWAPQPSAGTADDNLRGAFPTASSLPGSSRPLVLVDLSVPRSVTRDVASVEGVRLFDMDDITAFVTEKLGERRAEIPAVERIIAEELQRYSASLAARSVSPLVSQAREMAEKTRLAELERLERSLRGLEPSERQAVELLSRRLVTKLLHSPTVTLKSAAGTPRGQALAEAFRELFGL